MSERPSPAITGTADKPDLKRRPLALFLALLGYAAFMAALIVWAVQQHDAK